jgi:hypothetical protein
MPPWEYGPDIWQFLNERSIDQVMSRQPSPSLMSTDTLSYAVSGGSQYSAPSSVSEYSSYSGFQPADRALKMDAIQEGFQHSGSPPTSVSGYTLQSGSGFPTPVHGSQASQMQIGQILQGRPNQARMLADGAGRPGSSKMQEVTQGLGNYSLAARTQGSDVRTTEFQRNGQLLKHTFDPRMSVATLGVAPGQATSRPPRGQTSKSRLGDIKFPNYKVHSANFFVVGRAFLVLWAEPTGGAAVTKLSKFEVMNQLGQRVYSKARRFVVVREGAQCCHALPITSYGGQGVANPRVVKANHAIIYTGEVVPSPSSGESPGPGEAPMRSFPIRVDWNDPSEKLDPMSRINFGGVTLVQHNVMTKNCGMVNKNSLAALKMQFSNVFYPQPVVVAGPSSDREQTWTSRQTGPSGMMFGGGALVTAAVAGVAATKGSDGESQDEGEREGEGEVDDEDEENDDEGSKKDENEEVEEEDEDEDESEEGEADDANEDEDEDDTEGNAAEEDSDSAEE